MRTSLFSIVLTIMFTASVLNAQQVHESGNASTLPLKTAIINEASAEANADFWQKLSILRFSVHRAGSMSDVQKILEAFRKDAAVKSIVEGELNGDNKVFVLTLKVPQNKSWYKARFKEAGVKYVRINETPAQALTEL